MNSHNPINPAPAADAKSLIQRDAEVINKMRGLKKLLCLYPIEVDFVKDWYANSGNIYHQKFELFKAMLVQVLQKYDAIESYKEALYGKGMETRDIQECFGLRHDATLLLSKFFKKYPTISDFFHTELFAKNAIFDDAEKSLQEYIAKCLSKQAAKMHPTPQAFTAPKEEKMMTSAFKKPKLKKRNSGTVQIMRRTLSDGSVNGYKIDSTVRSREFKGLVDRSKKKDGLKLFDRFGKVTEDAKNALRRIEQLEAAFKLKRAGL